MFTMVSSSSMVTSWDRSQSPTHGLRVGVRGGAVVGPSVSVAVAVAVRVAVAVWLDASVGVAVAAAVGDIEVEVGDAVGGAD